MQLRSYKLTTSNKVAAVALVIVSLTVAMILLGLLVIVGLTILVGLVLAALGLGIVAGVYARLHRGRAGPAPHLPLAHTRLDPADEVFLPTVVPKEGAPE